MAKIDALQILREIFREDICTVSQRFYGNLGADPKEIQKQGAANFDEKFTTEPDEEHHYRAAYYMSADGYMSMHTKQNLTAFRTYLGDINNSQSSVLFIDYGCGPMTSGLALADVLSNSNPNYRDSVNYMGVDISKNMRTLAEGINLKFNLFHSKNFRTTDNLETLRNHIENCPSVVILSLSFVLGRDTLSGITGKYIAKSFIDFLTENEACTHFRVIFLNPQSKKNPNWSSNKFNVHWIQFLNELNSSDSLELSYTNIEDCEWNETREPCAMAMIKGTKKAES